MILSSNKPGVETGALAAAKAAGVPFSGYTHKPDKISELFELEELPKMFEVSKKLIDEADMIIFVGSEGSAYRKLVKRAKGTSLMRIDPKKVDGLRGIPLRGKKVYITGAREQQYPGIAEKTFEALKGALLK